MNCVECHTPIKSRAILVGPGGLLVCGPECKMAFQLAAIAGPPAKACNARNGVAAGDSAKKGVAGSGVKKAARKVRESDVSKSIAAGLNAGGVWNTRLQSGAVRVAGRNGQTHVIKLCTEGTPDRMFADGLVVFLEVKGSDGILSAKQSETLAILRSNGALAFVVDDVEQFARIRKAIAARVDRVSKITNEIWSLQNEIEQELQN